jgi:hypothetical protein
LSLCVVTDEQGASAEAAKALDGSDKVFSDEGLLIPVIPDDPLLRRSIPHVRA